MFAAVRGHDLVVNPWRTSGTSIEAPPEAWRWIAAWVSRQGRSAGMARPILDFIAASEAASRVQVAVRVPSTEQAEPAPVRLEEVEVAQAADLLGCSRELVRRRARQGRIRARRVGRTWLIDLSDIDRQTAREERPRW